MELRSTAAAFGAGCGAYLLLAGSVSWTEVGTAPVAAGLLTAFVTIRRIREGRPMVLPMPPLRVLATALTSLLTDTVRVGAVLARAIATTARSGKTEWQSFRPGGHKATDAGRRALVTVVTSMAPNGFVVDLRPSALPEADNGLLLHRLAPAPPLSGRDWPA